MPTTHSVAPGIRPHGMGKAGQTSSIRTAWTLFSGLGMVIGALAALALVPEAAAGRNPVGQYGLHVIGFAALVGGGFAVAQAATLGVLLRWSRHEMSPATQVRICLAWLGISGLGVSYMLFPLWSVDIREIFFLPLLAPFLMLPALAVMAGIQGLILRRCGIPPGKWMLRTMGGGLLGVLLGLLSYAMTAALLPLEVVGMGCVGLSMGWFQSASLAAALR